MATDLTPGDRVKANIGFLKCAYCGGPESSSATYDPDTKKSVYTGHPSRRDPNGADCPGVGKEVPAEIKVEQRVIYGLVVSNRGLTVWVRWDGEEKDSSVEVWDLQRNQRTPLQTFTEGVHDAR